jgi:hypothetical protein
MYFAGNNQGWSESAYLKTGAQLDAKTAATAILTARLWILPATCELVWAKYSNQGKPRDRIGVQKKYPIDGYYVNFDDTKPPSYYTMNRIKDAVEMAIETDVGDFCTRFLHGVPDFCVQDDELLGDVVVPGTPIPYPPTVYTTWYDLLGSYLATIKANSSMFRWYRPTTGGSAVPQTSDISQIYVRRLRDRKVGEVFGRSLGRANPR